MMAGGPLKPGVGLSGLVRLPEQSCPARCRVAQVRSSPLDATLGVTWGKKTLATAGTFPFPRPANLGLPSGHQGTGDSDISQNSAART